MKGEKVVYICENCSYESPKWLGKCPSCDSWDTFREVKIKNLKEITKSKVYRFDEIEIKTKNYIETKIEEVDRVLGGGIVEGGLYLIGGDPGIGKTTLLLKIADKISEEGKKVLFISAEESKEQIKMKAERIKVKGENIWISQSLDTDSIEEEIKELKPHIVVVDSIQTVFNPSNPSSPGSVSQVRDVGSFFLKISKKENIAVFLIGHVTKTGEIAGPKTLEHMVDCVLYLEGERKEGLRILRPFKNRFGSTEEIGIFEMREEGLVEVRDPSGLFLSDIKSEGIAYFPMMEGKRVIMVQIQALVSKTFFPVPKRESQGYDIRRLSMILTVIEKYLKLPLYQYDVYVNVIGGIKITETAGDLPLALAIISSFKGIELPEKLFSFGEIGLAGEIRNVKNYKRRVQEAKKIGFKIGVVPLFENSDGDLIKVRNLREVSEEFFNP
ncbi:MAG: DNA repair protein RadA [Candidatus Hydrothermales bacterium]